MKDLVFFLIIACVFYAFLGSDAVVLGRFWMGSCLIAMVLLGFIGGLSYADCGFVLGPN